MSKNDSGGAFPALDDAGTGLHLREHGLSKREYFAAKAMQSILAGADWSRSNCTIQSITKDSCRMADALLAELAK